MLIEKYDKPKCILINFCYQSAMTGMTLFDNMWQKLCLYSSMCVQLKWVRSYKLSESVLCLMDIHVITNVS